jgi:uncharacterized membrane protein
MQRFIGHILRAGVIAAFILTLTGGILYLFQYGFSVSDYRIFSVEPSSLRGVIGILSYALALDSRGLIQLGILLLMATPVIRVVFSVAGFALQRDLLYVAVTLIVLLVLAFSIIGGV